MLTPQFPQGREVIVIGNDITHLIGSFGPQEDQLFKVGVNPSYTELYIKTLSTLCTILTLYVLYVGLTLFHCCKLTPAQLASELSRQEGLPRVYIAANSGARIGLAEELKQLFRVAWVDPTHPDKGYRYLYLSPGDYMKVWGMGEWGNGGMKVCVC